MTVTIVDDGVPTTILLCEMDLVTLIHTAVDGKSTDVVTPRAADVATAINLEVDVHRVSPALLVPTAPRTAHFRSVFFFFDWMMTRCSVHRQIYTISLRSRPPCACKVIYNFIPWNYTISFHGIMNKRGESQGGMERPPRWDNRQKLAQGLSGKMDT